MYDDRTYQTRAREEDSQNAALEHLRRMEHGLEDETASEELLNELHAMGVDVTSPGIQRATIKQLTDLRTLLLKFRQQEPDNHKGKFNLDTIDSITNLLYYAEPRKRVNSNYLQIWLTPKGHTINISILFHNEKGITIYRGQMLYDKGSRTFNTAQEAEVDVPITSQSSQDIAAITPELSTGESMQEEQSEQPGEIESIKSVDNTMGETFQELPPATLENPSDILYESVPAHRFNSTGYSFYRRDGKPLTSREVYTFIREQKKQGNEELINVFRPHIKGKDPSGTSPTFEIRNSKYRYYGYSFDPEWGKKQEEEKTDSPSFRSVNATAIVRLKAADGTPFKGIRLHTTPDPNDKDYIGRKGNASTIYEAGEKVTIIGEQDDGKGGTWAKIRTADGKTGWIEQHWLVPVDKGYGKDYTLHYVQPGENVEGILRNIPGLERDIGRDNRAFAYVFWMMNKGNSGIYFDYEQYDKATRFSLKNQADPWYIQLRAMYQSIRLKQGAVIRIPTKASIDEAIQKGLVPSRPEAMNMAIKGARIIEGLLKGIPVGIYEQAKDTVTGLWDMIKSIFTGEILDQLVELYEALSAMSWETFSEMILAMIGVDPDKFKEIWNGTNITVAKRYEYFGEIIGRIIFEILMVIFVPGAVAGKALSKIPAVAKLVNTLKKVEKIIPDNVAGKLRKTEKVNEAAAPVATTTKKTADVLLAPYKKLRGKLDEVQRKLGNKNYTIFEEQLRKLPDDVLRKLDDNPDLLEAFAKRSLDDPDFYKAVQKGDLKKLDELKTPEYAPRIRERAVEDPKGHNFPYSFDQVILKTKPTTIKGGALGYAMKGFLNGKEVVYNMIVKNGKIVHRDVINVKNWPQRSKSFGWPIDINDIPTFPK